MTADKWQPIETAPKDGTAVLVGNKSSVWIAAYTPRYQSGFEPANKWQSLMLNHQYMPQGSGLTPSHWMPLPSPPK